VMILFNNSNLTGGGHGRQVSSPIVSFWVKKSHRKEYSQNYDNTNTYGFWDVREVVWKSIGGPNTASPLKVFLGVIRWCPLQFPSLSAFPCDPASLYYDLWNGRTAENNASMCVVKLYSKET
jgi:hypothetical protein